MDRYRRLLVFVRSGGENIELGRPGQGPGEIQGGGPVAIAGTRLVMAERGRISVWDTTGAFIGSVAAPSVLGALSITPWDSSSVLFKTTTQVETGVAGSFRAQWLDLQQMAITEPVFETKDPDRAELHLGCASCTMVRHGNGLITTLDEQSGRFARIDIDTIGGRVFPGSGRERVPFSEREWRDYVMRAREQGNYFAMSQSVEFRLPLDRPVPEPGFLKPMLPRDGSVGVTPDGRIWLLTGVEERHRTQIDVFTPDGEWSHVVHIGEPLERIGVGGWWLVGLVYDDLGVPRLYRYDLKEVPDEAAP